MPRASSRWLFFAANLLHKKNHVVPCSFCRYRTRSQLNFPRPAVIVKILSMLLANAKANVIKITYEGVLKSADVVYGDNGNLNTATLFVLPNDSVTKAQVDDPSEAKAVTCSGELFKYTTDNGAKKPLADAEFEVARDGAKLEFYPSKDYAGVYYLANEENLNFEHVNKNTAVKTSTLVTPADGMIIIRSLAGGSYTVLPKTAASALSCSSRWAHWL